MKPIHLHLSKPTGRLKTGASRFWGDPDLPEGAVRPLYVDDEGRERPYCFICQINLEEAAPYDPENRLPHRGMLSFFARIDNYLGFDMEAEPIGGTISDREAVKVLYTPSCENLRAVPPEETEDDLPHPAELRIDFDNGPEMPSDEHALFAPPTHRPWEHWDAPYGKWRILLQIDSFEGDDFSLNFMDVGVLDLLIAPADLERHRFENVRAIVLSS